MASTPILPFAVWASGTNQNSVPANDNSLRNQILNGLVISDAVTAQPGSPVDGDIYILAGTHTGAQWDDFFPDDLVIYRGGTWYAFQPTPGVVVNFEGYQQQFTGSDGWSAVSGGGGMSNPMTTAQDLIRGGTAGAPTRLAVGTNGQVLTVTAGAVAWGTPASGMTNPLTTTGDVIYSTSGTTPGRLGIGNTGDVLTVVSGVPVWAPPGIEQNSQSSAYTLVLGDKGKHILHPSADTTARIWTIPANSSVAFPVNTAVTFINQNAAGVITIAITTDTMRLAGVGTTGSRTLAANGIATAVKITSTEWIISGTGLT